MAHTAYPPKGSKPSRYFGRRPSTVAPAFGESDWKAATDPDGLCRDRTLERAQHLDDLRHELGFVNNLTPGRVLDIGCGLGFFLSGIDESWEKYGIEMSDFAISHACEWGRVVKGPIEDACYPAASFDVVVMHHVIEHIEDPDQTIAEVRRILRPGGHLVLGTPDFDSACARRFGPRYRLLHDQTHVSLFSNESLHRLLRDHGFLIEYVDYPFFDTRHFNEENLVRMLDSEGVSPPFYGSFMTFYCRKPKGGALMAVAQRLGSFAQHELLDVDQACADLVFLAAATLEKGGGLLIEAGPGTEVLNEFAKGIWRTVANESGLTCPVVDSGTKVGEHGGGAFSADLILRFRFIEGAGTFWVDRPEGRGGGAIRLETAAIDGSESVTSIEVPLLFGVTRNSAEVPLLGALLQELWSRREMWCEGV